MSGLRLEIRLDLLRHNTKVLVDRLGRRGIGLTAVTKATLGSPEVAGAMLAAGAHGLGDSRIENIERLRAAGITAPITLIRSPMLSQVGRVVAHADRSLNTEGRVLAALSAEAVRQDRTHGVIVMVELGDLREGVLPAALPGVLERAELLDNLLIEGIGANLACQHGIAPDDKNMAVLSALATDHEARTGRRLRTVTGGNSASYDWVMGADDVGQVDDLRMGEALLLGVEPLHRRPIDGLRTDAITLVAEVIERSAKPPHPWGTSAQSAFGRPPISEDEAGDHDRAIVALGRQDVDPDGLRPPPGTTILGTSSDHLVLRVDRSTGGAETGGEVRFDVDYSALLRAMTSPFVERVYLDEPTA